MGGLPFIPCATWRSQLRTCTPVGLVEHGEGELPDLRWQGHVAVGGGVGLAVVGKPVQHGGQGLPCGLVLAGGSSAQL
jgi:hypothetical protein